MMPFTDEREAVQAAKLATGLLLAFENPVETGATLRKLVTLYGQVAGAQQELFDLRKSATAKAAADATELMQLKTSIEQERQKAAAKIERREQDLAARELAATTRERLLREQEAELDKRNADHEVAVLAHEARATSLRAVLG